MKKETLTLKRHIQLDKLTDMLQQAINTYNLNAVLKKDVGQASDVEASKKIVQIAQEINSIERELEALAEAGL